MDSRKILAFVLLESVSTQAVSGGDVSPIAALFLTISAPTILIGTTTSLTTELPKVFKSAKTDALAYRGLMSRFAAPSLSKRPVTNG